MYAFGQVLHGDMQIMSFGFRLEMAMRDSIGLVCTDNLNIRVDNERLENRSEPDSAFYAQALKVCGDAKDMSKGRQIHHRMLNSEHGGNVYLCNHLIEMYGKCGSLDDARLVFDAMEQPNVYSWTIMLKAYAQNGHLQEAKSLFDEMPDKNVVSWTSMIVAYTQRGHLEEARNIFESMPGRNVFSWNAMITAYGQEGHLDEARILFDKMKRRNVVTWTAMVSAYAQNGNLEEARSLFDDMPKRNVVSWNVMVTAYAQNGHLQEAKRLFDRMPQRDHISWNSMLGAYASNGHLEEARSLFDQMHQRDVVSWTTMMTAYAQNGRLQEARAIFDKMPKRDVVSWNCMVGLCAENGHLDEARLLFGRMPQRDLVSWDTMIAAYVAHGDLHEAKSLLKKMPFEDVVPWTLVLTAYARNGQGKEAIQLFQEMDLEGVQPNEITFMVVVDACATAADLAKGKIIHDHIVTAEFQVDVALENALLSMYGKCGSVRDARRTFDGMTQYDEISWNTLISAYAQSGYPQQAFELFYKMNQEGMEPTEMTLLCILAMSSHTGLLVSARDCFVSVSRDYGIAPTLDHYTCMIDHLGRTGRVYEAQDLINNMPFEPDAVAWRTLLGASQTHPAMLRGAQIAEHVCEMDPGNSGPYVLLSNLHASGGSIS